MVSENENYFIAKKSFFNNKKLMNTNIKNNWGYNDLSRAEFISLDTLKSKTIKWENKSIALIENKWKYDSTIDLLKRRYYWPTLVNDSKNYIKECSKCQLARGS